MSPFSYLLLHQLRLPRCCLQRHHVLRLLQIPVWSCAISSKHVQHGLLVHNYHHVVAALCAVGLQNFSVTAGGSVVSLQK